MSDVNLVGWARSHISESDWQRLRWQYDADLIAQAVQEATSANSEE